MLPEYDAELLTMSADLCKTFSDPKRLMIIQELRNGEKQVGELVMSLNMPKAVILRELAILQSKGAVILRHQDTDIYYCISDTKITEACDLVHQVLLNQLEESQKIIIST